MLITALIEEEVALAVEQLDSLRELHKEQLQGLLRAECYVGTELMQLQNLIPRWSLDRPPERERLHNQLSAIEVERRKHIAVYEDKLRGLYEKLLLLAQRHGQVSR